MPSKSEAQRKKMAIAAHHPSKQRGKHIPQDVAREYNRADKRAAAKKKASHKRASR